MVAILLGRSTMSRASPRQHLIGQLIGGRYLVKRLIGVGGMGAIYEVEHQRIGRPFAVKTLSPELADDAESLSRFRREADIIARLRHPNIVDIVDWETLSDGSPCIVMELLRGEDLGALMTRSIYLPWPLIAQIGGEILSALATAHKAGVIHRDLKPKNIFLADDGTGKSRAKLLDFGISKVKSATTMVTADSRILGTPAYMSPEQADGKHDAIGPGTDTWAMGAILYEMATGRPAFDADSIPSVLYRICFKDPEPMEPLRSDVPAAFAEVVSRALSREPARRLTDATTMGKRLRKALAGLDGTGEITRVDGTGEATRVEVASAPPAAAVQASAATIFHAPAASAAPLLDTGDTTTVETAIIEPIGVPERSRRTLIAVVLAIAVVILAMVLMVTAGGDGPKAAAEQPAMPAASLAPEAGDAAARIPDAGAPAATAPAPAPNAAQPRRRDRPKKRIDRRRRQRNHRQRSHRQRPDDHDQAPLGNRTADPFSDP